MSRHANAKVEQGYEPKPVLKVCENCLHFNPTGNYSEAFGNELVRCALGGFKVKKKATCNLFEENQA